MVSACARRQQVAYASTRGLSQRRACALLRTARSGLRYESKKAAKDAAAVTKMVELARQYPRYGYRRIRVFLGHDGHRMSNDRAYRLWLRVPAHVDHRFRRKPITDSGRSRSPIPVDADQRSFV